MPRPAWGSVGPCPIRSRLSRQRLVASLVLDISGRRGGCTFRFPMDKAVSVGSRGGTLACARGRDPEVCTTQNDPPRCADRFEGCVMGGIVFEKTFFRAASRRRWSLIVRGLTRPLWTGLSREPLCQSPPPPSGGSNDPPRPPPPPRTSQCSTSLPSCGHVLLGPHATLAPIRTAGVARSAAPG